MLCLSSFELYSRWVLLFEGATVLLAQTDNRQIHPSICPQSQGKAPWGRGWWLQEMRNGTKLDCISLQGHLIS